MVEYIQQEGAYPYPYSYPSEPQDLSLVEQTNPKEILKEIEMTLRGMMFNETKKEWYLPEGCKPLVNEFGLNSLMADARPIINQITILSNLEVETISKIIIQLSNVVISKIERNWKEFGLDKSNLRTCRCAITNPAYMAAMRAKGEGERKFLKTSVRAIESFTSAVKPQGGSSTSDKLKFWR
jgi:hypothetical protein